MSCSSSAVVGSVKSSIDQVSSPDLSISPRLTNALDGGDIVHTIKNLPHTERSSYILNEVLHGNVPEFFRKLV